MTLRHIAYALMLVDLCVLIGIAVSCVGALKNVVK